MPILDNPRHEALAQARAEGSRLALLDAARPYGMTARERQKYQLHIIDEFGARPRAAAGLAAL